MKSKAEYMSELEKRISSNKRLRLAVISFQIKGSDIGETDEEAFRWQREEIERLEKLISEDEARHLMWQSD